MAISSFRASVKILLYYTHLSSIGGERVSRGCRFTRENSRKTNVFLLSRVSRRSVLGEFLSSPLRLAYAPVSFVCVYVNRVEVERGQSEKRREREKRATEKKPVTRKRYIRVVGRERPVEQVSRVE